MSIRIPSPSIVLNSDDWDIRSFRMDISIEVPEKTRIDKVFDRAAKDCSQLKRDFDGALTLILNCHGYYEEVKEGKTWYGGQDKKLIPGFGIALGTGIKQSNAFIFGKFAPTVDKIIINACGVAGISRPGQSDGDGNLLCSSIAKYAQATVQCSQSEQTAKLFIREDPGYIDDCEGVVLTYGPDGSVIKVDRYA